MSSSQESHAPLSGMIVINKPYGITSMDVIRRLRKITGVQKIGHAGTLDPLATGVLLVCLGAATKKIDKFMNTTKAYNATIDLSAFSTTDDAEGALTQVTPATIPATAEIIETLKSFTGTIQQTPPVYSAIKINGQPAYKRSARGEQLQLQPRPVTIDTLDLVAYDWPQLTINVTCSKGTYIRSLARDIGTKLKAGGYITALTRTAVGPYALAQARTLEHITALTQADLLTIE